MSAKDISLKNLLPFTQVKFSIKSLHKMDVDEILEPSDAKLRLTSDKNISIDVNSEDARKVKVIGDISAYVYSEDDVSGREGKKPFISVCIEVLYSTSEDMVPEGSEVMQQLLIAQTNVQLTDVLNYVLMHSELKGDRFPYDI